MNRIRIWYLQVLGFLLLGFLGVTLAGCKTMEGIDDVGRSLFRKGGVSVRTQPSGASIYINEKFIGRSPLSEPLKPGIYRLVVEKKGFETQEEWVEVPKGTTAKIQIHMEKY